MSSYRRKWFRLSEWEFSVSNCKFPAFRFQTRGIEWWCFLACVLYGLSLYPVLNKKKKSHNFIFRHQQSNGIVFIVYETSSLNAASHFLPGKPWWFVHYLYRLLPEIQILMKLQNNFGSEENVAHDGVGDKNETQYVRTWQRLRFWPKECHMSFTEVVKHKLLHELAFNCTYLT